MDVSLSMDSSFPLSLGNKHFVVLFKYEYGKQDVLIATFK